ncbi:MAG TPA: RluA family pseudouridine synthase [Steroidobacteraceae bacterium]|nr:RluA family pseudouridine synthase [Steroidobacteraceae bacterium]
MPEHDSQETRTKVQHLEVTAEEAGQRLDNFVRRRLGDVPRSRVYRVIRKGEVRVNGRRAGPETRLKAQDRIRLPPVRVLPAAEPRRPAADLLERIRCAVIHEAPRLLVLDKPAGVAVHGGSGVSAGVIEALRILRPQESLELVHRLDRDTSGCLLVARDPATLRTLHALLRTDGFEKRYLALLKGKWNLGEKRIDVPLRTDTRVGGERTVRADASGKPSTSRFRPVQFFGRAATLVEVTLDTGRTHQIRVHAAHAGHPVAGDAKYGDESFNRELRALGLKRMFLHASSVSFTWPQGGEFSVNTPLPAELTAVLERLAAAPRLKPTATESPQRAARRPAR